MSNKPTIYLPELPITMEEIETMKNVDVIRYKQQEISILQVEVRRMRSAIDMYVSELNSINSMLKMQIRIAKTNVKEQLHNLLANGFSKEAANKEIYKLKDDAETIRQQGEELNRLMSVGLAIPAQIEHTVEQTKEPLDSKEAEQAYLDKLKNLPK